MERQKKIQPGDTFGRWTVIGSWEETNNKERKWLCQCACGTKRYVLERSLLYGGSQSCGCLKKERIQADVSHDLRHQVFGDLTVLQPVPPQDKRKGIWWQCRCTCGQITEIPGTLLFTGRRTHCGCKAERAAAFCDITGQRFQRLTALFPSDSRDAKGNVIWHCRCDCGNEIDVSYNALVYSTMKSCGCQKKEHDQKLSAFLTHVGGTSIDLLRSKKVPKNSTTGVKGVYYIKGKYHAKIVFQGRQYWPGAYADLADAVQARKAAEEAINEPVTAFYAQWKTVADADSDWAAAHPIQMEIAKHGADLQVIFSPRIEEIEKHIPDISKNLTR